MFPILCPLLVLSIYGSAQVRSSDPPSLWELDIKADDTRGNFLSNVARRLWKMLPSTGSQVRHRAND